MKMQKTGKKIISQLLALAMVLSFLPAGAFAAVPTPGITNPTVALVIGATLEGKTPQEINDTRALYLNTVAKGIGVDLIGDIDAFELRQIYPNLIYIDVRNTNITAVKNNGYRMLIDNDDTFINGRSLVREADAVVTLNYLKTQPRDLAISELYNKLKLRTATGDMAIPDGLVELSYSIDGGAAVNVAADGVIPQATLDALSVGVDVHTLTLSLKVANSDKVFSFHYKLNVYDTNFILVFESDPAEVFQGGTLKATLTKYMEDGTLGEITEDDLYNVSINFAAATSSFSQNIVGGKLSITIMPAVDEAVGNYTLTVEEGASGKTVSAGFAVTAIPVLAPLEQPYERNQDIEDSQLTADAPIFVKGGTPISSQDIDQANAYTGETVYVLYADGAPVNKMYKGLVHTSVQASDPVSVTTVVTEEGHVAIKVTAKSLASAEGSFDVWVGTTGNHITINYKVLQAAPVSYLIYAVPEALFGTTLGTIINNPNDPNYGKIVKASQYDWSAADHAFLPNEGESAGLQMIENSRYYLVLAARYSVDESATVYVLDNSVITKWYDGSDAGTDAEVVGGIILGGDSNITATTKPNVFVPGTKALEVAAGGYITDALNGVNNGIVGVVINDGTASNNIFAKIEVQPRQVERYIIADSGSALPIGGKWSQSWEDGLAVTAVVNIGTSRSYAVFTVYNNGAVERTNFAEGGFTTESGNAGLLSVEPLTTGSLLTLKATRAGGADDSKKDTAVQIKLLKDGKEGVLSARLGASKIESLTYVVETPRGMKRYNADGTLGDVDYKTYTKEELLATSAAALEIPRGLTAYVWVVPVFTNNEMYNAHETPSYYKTYGVTNGFTLTSDTATESNPLGAGVIQPGAGDYANAYKIDTNNSITVKENTAITQTFTTSGTSLTAKGVAHDLTASVFNTALDIKITAPVVTGISLEQYDAAADTYAPLTTAADGAATLSGHVGEEIKLRLIARYSDGVAVDLMGNRNPGEAAYESGTRFTNRADTYGNYDFAVGPTIPAGASFIDATADELSVLYGYFMSKNPREYIQAVNPTTGAPNWNFGESVTSVQSILSTLTQKIKLHGYVDNGSSRAPLGTTNPGIIPTWLYKADASGNQIVPGHYSITLKEAGQYVLDFSNSLDANGVSQETGLADIANAAGAALKIKLEVKEPVARKVYLVGANNESAAADSSGRLTPDTIDPDNLYRFDNVAVSGNYKSFIVYPVILDETYFVNHPGAVLPNQVTLADVGSGGVNFVKAGDWTSFIDSWTTTGGDKLTVAEKTDSEGNLYLEVTVLNNSGGFIPRATPVEINLDLTAVPAQSADPVHGYDLTGGPLTDPGELKVYTGAGTENVVDIVLVGNAAQNVTLGDPVSVDVQYQQQQSGTNRNLEPKDFPDHAGYVSGGVNALTIKADPANPGGCTYAKGSGSTLVFTPTKVGTYTFTLTTKNSVGATIPTPPAVRTITFTVSAATLDIQTVYYGQLVDITTVPADAATIVEQGGDALDAALLSAGKLKMNRNEAGSTTVVFKNAAGAVVAQKTVTLGRSNMACVLLPDVYLTFANAESKRLQWSVYYTDTAGGNFTASEFSPVETLTYWGGTDQQNFLTFDSTSSTATAHSDDTTRELRGVYTATDPSGRVQTITATLNPEATLPGARHYQLAERVDGNYNFLSELTFNAVGEIKDVYLLETVDGRPSGSVSYISAEASPAGVVDASNLFDKMRITALANGSVMLKVTDVANNQSITVPVRVNISGTADSDLAITTQPSAVSVTAGETARFTAAAASTGRVVSYQWQRLTGADWVNLQGANGTSLSIANTTVAMSGGKYRCYITDGSRDLYTAEAALTVSPAGSLAITGQPVNVSVVEGQAASFTVAASSSVEGHTMTYQWERAGADNVWSNIEGATGATYSIASALLNMNATQYRCKVSDSFYNLTTNAATLSVTPVGELNITAQPQNVTATVGGNASFTVVAATGVAGATITYQWQSKTGDAEWSNITGATGATYSIPGVTQAMNGAKYRCQISDGTNNMASNEAVLTISALTISTQPQNASVTAPAAASFSVTAASTAPAAVLRYQWQSKSGAAEWTNIVGATGATYSVTGTTTAMSGNQYRCVITDGVSTVISTAATLTVTSGSTGGGGGGGGGGAAASTTYTLTFATNGGSAVASVTENKGAVVELKQTTTRANYVFTGWYSDAALKNKITTVTLSKDMTVYAGWEASTAKSEQHVAYMTGASGAFRPDAQITRAEAAMLFARLLQGDSSFTGSYSSAFKDVVQGAWYANAVGYVQSIGLMTGLPDGSFHPDQLITRAEFAVIAKRFAAAAGISGADTAGTAAFSDVTGTHWAASAVATLSGNGWVNGYSDGTFRPQNNIARAEVVSIVNRVLGRAVDKNYIQANQSMLTAFPDVQTGYWAYYDIMEATNSHTCTKSADGIEVWSK